MLDAVVLKTKKILFLFSFLDKKNWFVMFGGKRKPALRPAQDRGQARGGGKSLTQVIIV